MVASRQPAAALLGSRSCCWVSSCCCLRRWRLVPDELRLLVIGVRLSQGGCCCCCCCYRCATVGLPSPSRTSRWRCPPQLHRPLKRCLLLLLLALALPGMTPPPPGLSLPLILIRPRAAKSGDMTGRYITAVKAGMAPLQQEVARPAGVGVSLGCCPGWFTRCSSSSSSISGPDLSSSSSSSSLGAGGFLVTSSSSSSSWQQRQQQCQAVRLLMPASMWMLSGRSTGWAQLGRPCSSSSSSRGGWSRGGARCFQLHGFCCCHGGHVPAHVWWRCVSHDAACGDVAGAAAAAVGAAAWAGLLWVGSSSSSRRRRRACCWASARPQLLLLARWWRQPAWGGGVCWLLSSSRTALLHPGVADNCVTGG